MHKLTIATFCIIVVLTASVVFLSSTPGSTLDSSVNKAVEVSSSLSQDPKPFNQQEKLEELGKQIAGQEQKPADQVFKNVQLLKGMPAGRLLKVMEIGYAKSLGVDCTHCHVVDQWEKDDKPTKQVARDMVRMAAAINNDLLKNIKNLKGPNPIINCTTCHRGQVKPALNLTAK